jgi:hypothetical protein
MSIPQICPSCGNHVSGPHAKDCCYATPEYAHIGWPSYHATTGTGSLTLTGITGAAKSTYTHTISMEELTAASNAALDGYRNLKEQENATAIRRLLEYLEKEPESGDIVGEMAPNFAAITLLKKRSDELRKEAAGISLVESRAKRIFAADILESLIQELTE